MQLTAARNNQAESLEAEQATCEQHRAAIAELAEEALAAKVLLAPNLSDSCALLSRYSTRVRLDQTQLCCCDNAYHCSTRGV